MKILIAEDDPTSRALMAGILNSAQAGYDLLEAEDGLQAWEMLEANPDARLAIVDLAMPRMNGLELIDRIRGDQRFAALPVIVCTASTDRTTVATVAARGVTNFLAKPFTKPVVLEKVWQACRPSPTSVPVLKDLSAARQRMEIDRETHRELLGHFVRVADMWATDARRATDYPRVRSLAIRAANLRLQFGNLGAAAVAARFQDAEEALMVFRAKPLAAEMPACLKKTQQLGEKIQIEIDRLREMLDTIG